MKTPVSIVELKTYEDKEARRALLELLAPLGGLIWVREGMKIGIKVNLVRGIGPETACCTHPVLVKELARLLAERGAIVTVGDSPGGPFEKPFLESVYKGSGINIVRDASAELNYDFEVEEINFPEGIVLKKVPLCSWLLKQDAVINFAKLKTHGLTGLTAAVKNLYGAVPGIRKTELHYSFPKIDEFCNMLIDINECLKPTMSIIDACMCMEGNGPTSGEPRYMGALLASKNQYFLDLVAARLINLQNREAATVFYQIERGLSPESEDELNIIGDYKKFIIEDFKTLSIGNEARLFAGKSIILNYLAEKLLSPRPRVDKDACIGCGLCADHCPMDTIEIKNKKAKIYPKNCIRCFCCQEFCPRAAISSERSPLAKLLIK